MQEILEQGRFTLTDESGTDCEYATLFTFYNQKYNKHYVVYNDNENIYSSSYNPEDLEFNLQQVENEEELKMVNEHIIQTINQYTTNTEEI